MIDIGVMIYCIMNEISYSSSFNIFAVVAGILLLNRNMFTARVMRWLNLVFLLMFIVALPLILIGMPLELSIAHVRLDVWGSIVTLVLWVAMGFLFYWAHKQFSNKEAKLAFEGNGYSPNAPKSAIAMGPIILVGSIFLIWYMANGETPMKARELAKQQLGNEYEYHVTNVHSSGEHASVIVVAYNSNEIRHVKVGW
ncbi:MAG: hypothetical protein RPU90_09905 [Candidatus Sedimenticola sp. (ex Thyasira tokunagai)]